MLDLLNVLLPVFLVLHELHDEGVDAGEVQLWLSSQYLCDVEFVVGGW